MVNGVPSMLNATWKLTAWKLFWSMTMPLPRISSSDSGRDVTLVTKTSLMTADRESSSPAGRPAPSRRESSRRSSPGGSRRGSSRRESRAAEAESAARPRVTMRVGGRSGPRSSASTIAPLVSVSIAVARLGSGAGRQRQRGVDLGRDVLGDGQRRRIDDETDADDVELELGEGLLLGGDRSNR